MPLAAAEATGGSFAAPDEGCRLKIPATRGGFQPFNDLGWTLWVLAFQCPAFDDTLDGLSHIQPGPAQRRVERNDAVVEQPDHEGW